jgi:hypothetical protein
MKLGADAQMRRLVEQARPLDVSVDRTSRKNAHPVGLGLNRTQSYPTGNGNIFLPKFGDGLQRLRDTFKQPVPIFSTEELAGAWRILLSEAPLQLPLPAPDEARLLRIGIDVSPEARSRLRQILLAAVIRPGDERLTQGELSAPRSAAAVLLTVQDAESGRGVEDAWLHPTWSESSRQLAMSLEPFYLQIGLASQKVGRRVGLVVGEPRDDSTRDSFLEGIRASAAVVGISLDIYEHNPRTHMNIIGALGSNRPAHLITLGDGSAMDTIRETFRNVNGPRSVSSVPSPADGVAHETLRERFLVLAKIAGSLMPLYDSAPDPDKITIPATPVACYHEGPYQYVQDSATKLWWTQDEDGHGNSIFKTFKKVGGELMFQHDHDDAGNVITVKHKGPHRDRISIKQLNSCSHPASHTQVPRRPPTSPRASAPVAL